MKIKIAKVLGLNTDQQATLISSENLGEENIFLGLLNLSCDDAFTRGRQLLSEASDEYLNDTEQMGEDLENIFVKTRENLKDAERFDLLIASISGKTLYLLGYGQIQVFLKRNGTVKPLLVDGSGQLISGFLEPGDRIVLGTQSLIDQIQEEGVKAALDYPFETWEEEISTLLSPEPQESAALLIEVAAEAIEIPAVASPEESVFRAPSDKKLTAMNVDYFKKIIPAGRKMFLFAIIVLSIVLITGVVFFTKNKINSAKEVERARLLQEEQKKQQAEELLKQKANFTLFLDLGLIKTGFATKRISMSGGKILLLDPDIKTLVVIDLNKKSHQILAGQSQLGDGQLASLNGNSAFIYSEDKGVIRVDIDNQKLTIVTKGDKDWKGIYDLVGFGGNVYILDIGGQIWKYIALDSGYSDKREYLSKGVKTDFSNALNMQIESSVYVLKAGGEILRYTRGLPDHFSIGGLDRGIKDPKSFFTSSDTDNLYVLDSGNSRLVVLSKTGEYKEAYQGDKFGAASDLVVDEKNKKVYLLEGSKIYVADIK